MQLTKDTSNIVTALVVAATATFVGYMMWSHAPATGPSVEGFGGVARGAGLPDCVRDSADAAELASFFIERQPVAEEADDDFREFLLILSKLSCFKKDLLSISGLVEATRYQPYSTAHDIEAVAETTARCLAKTIPKRDLDLILEKWSSRGLFLLKRLCTGYNLEPPQYESLKKKYNAILADLSDIANGACLAGEPIIAGKKQGRATPGYEPPELAELRQYKGYY